MKKQKSIDLSESLVLPLEICHFFAHQTGIRNFRKSLKRHFRSFDTKDINPRPIKTLLIECTELGTNPSSKAHPITRIRRNTESVRGSTTGRSIQDRTTTVTLPMESITNCIWSRTCAICIRLRSFPLLHTQICHTWDTWDAPLAWRALMRLGWMRRWIMKGRRTLTSEAT